MSWTVLSIESGMITDGARTLKRERRETYQLVSYVLILALAARNN